LLVVALLPACAGRPSPSKLVPLESIEASVPEPVQAALLTLESIEPAVQAGQLMLQLKLKNNTRSTMAVSGMRYRVELDGAEFSWGVSRQSADVPAGGEALFDVTLPGQVPVLDPAATHLPYHLAGTVYLGEERRQLPFRHTGRLQRPGTVSP